MNRSALRQTRENYNEVLTFLEPHQARLSSQSSVSVYESFFTCFAYTRDDLEVFMKKEDSAKTPKTPAPPPLPDAAINPLQSDASTSVSEGPSKDAATAAPEDSGIDKIRARIQTAHRQYFVYTIGRRPVILPFIMEL
jgi:hypothetical protein